LLSLLAHEGRGEKGGGEKEIPLASTSPRNKGRIEGGKDRFCSRESWEGVSSIFCSSSLPLQGWEERRVERRLLISPFSFEERGILGVSGSRHRKGGKGGGVNIWFYLGGEGGNKMRNFPLTTGGGRGRVIPYLLFVSQGRRGKKARTFRQVYLLSM